MDMGAISSKFALQSNPEAANRDSQLRRNSSDLSVIIQALGYRAVMYVVDEHFPEDSQWIYLNGTDEQIAASYYLHNDSNRHSLVTRMRSLTSTELDMPVEIPLGGRHTCLMQVTPPLGEAMRLFDRNAFSQLSIEDRKSLGARESDLCRISSMVTEFKNSLLPAGEQPVFTPSMV